MFFFVVSGITPLISSADSPFILYGANIYISKYQEVNLAANAYINEIQDSIAATGGHQFNFSLLDTHVPGAVSCSSGPCTAYWSADIQYYYHDDVDTGPWKISIDGPMYFFCRPGFQQLGDSCVAVGPVPDLNKGMCKCREGNPINPLTGNKIQIEQDYVGQGNFPLIFERTYNSSGQSPGGSSGIWLRYGYAEAHPFSWIQKNDTSISPIVSGSYSTSPISIGTSSHTLIDFSWRHSYDRSLIASTWINSTIAVYHGSSRSSTFNYSNGLWIADQGQHQTSLSQHVDSIGNTLGWSYVNENDEIENYDNTGRLLSITNKAGLVQTLKYDSASSKLISVTDPFGKNLLFSYDSVGRLSGVTSPDGGKYIYDYDNNENLSMVTYPDGKKRQYIYDDTNFTHALTGIIDENGARFATWTYDNQGDAITSEHSIGVDKVSISYPSFTSPVATDIGGATRTYSSQLVNGIAQASQIVETCGTNCSRTRSMSYDSNGNVSIDTDFNGTVTTYQYDLSRDLETSHTEASGTPQARTTTTTWHPNYRLPLQIAEPKRLTIFTYDASGNVLTKTVHATTDANGSKGLSATLTGKARTWTNTYNSFGQILTATGPRTDVNDTSTYSYDTSGNLTSITNAAGHVTTMSNYDLNGRVGMITAPNGETTSLTYTPRGWLSSKIVTANGVSETTSYTYDGVGQLIQVTLPDSSTVSYTYDDAHRLTGMNDSLGNSIVYALDNMGNRISEQVKDTGGVLARQTSRVFDALSRLQQQTGGMQ